MNGESRPVVLVTGATGFIGSRLCNRLSATHSVWCLNRGDSPSPNIRQELSWDGDVAFTAAQIAEVAPQAVIHLAARYRFDDFAADTRELVDASIDLTLAVLYGAMAHGSRVILAGTRFQRLHHGGPINVYSSLKRAQEDLGILFARKGLPVVHLEIGDVYGPGDSRGKLIDRLLQTAVTKHRMDVTNPENVLVPVHLTDALRAIHASAYVDLPDSGFHYFGIQGPDGPLRVHQIIELISEIVGETLAVDYPEKRQHPSTGDLILVPSLYTAVPGAAPQISMVKGLSEMLGISCPVW